MSRLSGATGGITTGVATGALALLSAGGLATLALIGSVAPAGIGPGLPPVPFAVVSPPAVDVTARAEAPRAEDRDAAEPIAVPAPTLEVVQAAGTGGQEREQPALAGGESTPAPSPSSTPAPSVIAEPVASVAPTFASVAATTPAATHAAKPDKTTREKQAKVDRRRGHGHAYGRPDFVAERAKPQHTLPPVAAPANLVPLPTPAAASVPVPSPAPGLAVAEGSAHGHGLGLGTGNPAAPAQPGDDGSGAQTWPDNGNPAAPGQLRR